MITGLERSCRAELIGFASPIGRLSAILRITDEATGGVATSVVPVEQTGPIELTSGAAEMMLPPSEVRARDLRLETEPLRLVPSLGGEALLEELLKADFEGSSVHQLALVLTTALHAGALAGMRNDIEKDTSFDVGPKSKRKRHKEVSA